MLEPEKQPRFLLQLHFPPYHSLSAVSGVFISVMYFLFGLAQKESTKEKGQAPLPRRNTA